MIISLGYKSQVIDRYYYQKSHRIVMVPNVYKNIKTLKETRPTLDQLNRELNR